MKDNRGFTLIEMLVAVTVFITVVTVISTLFISAVRAQRQSLAYQELLDQTSYVMEHMSRAIRMAKKDDIEILVGDDIVEKHCLSGERGVNYEFVGQCLKFRNYKNECQEFCLEGTKLKEIREEVKTDLTSPDLKVTSFNAVDPRDLSSWKQPPDDSLQPLVEIFLEVEGRKQSKIQIKTSVSQRDLDIQR